MKRRIEQMGTQARKAVSSATGRDRDEGLCSTFGMALRFKRNRDEARSRRGLAHGRRGTHDGTRKKIKRQLSRSYERAFNDHEPADAVCSLRRTEVHSDTPDGAEAFVKSTTALIARCPGLRVDIKRVIAEGNLVAAHNS
jgi:hypothetical protein